MWQFGKKAWAAICVLCFSVLLCLSPRFAGRVAGSLCWLLRCACKAWGLMWFESCWLQGWLVSQCVFCTLLHLRCNAACKGWRVEVNEIELAACKTLASILRTHLSALSPEQSDIKHEIRLVGSVWVAVDVLEPLILSGTHIAGALRHIRRNRPAALLAVLNLE